MAANVTSPAKILVVDDNRVIRELVTRQLAKLGLQSETALDGADALAKLSQASYGLVFMDVQMPEMDGIMVTQELRRREAASGAHTIVIALTGHGSRIECIQCGMDDFIAKPMNVVTLKAILQKWIPSQVFLEV